MIDILRSRGIKDEKILRVMGKIDRHLFVQDIFFNRSYEDSALPIGCQQTISQPYTVAFMTEELRVKQGDKVLEIGTGSGYQAAVLAELGTRVFTIERHMDLLTEARKRLDRLGYNVVSKSGDGTIGWKEFAPFEGIIVTAGAPQAPQSLLDQLKDGGRLIIPVGDLDVQNLHVITRVGAKYTTRQIQGFKFVPLIGKQGWSKE